MPPQVHFLIIGASGFIGREVLRALGPGCATGTYYSHPFAGGVYFDARTMRLHDLLLDTAEPFTHALILLGNRTIDECARDGARSWDMNVRAVIDLVDDLRAGGVVPIFASSDAVFDGRTGGYGDDAALSPILTYGRQKAAVEEYLRGLPPPWLVARLSKTVSATEPRGLIGGWMADLAAGRPLRCARDQRCSPIHVADVSRALITLAERGRTGVFNVGGPQAFSRLELAELLVRSIRRRAPLAAAITGCSIRDLDLLEARPLDISMDSRKAYAALGFRFRPMEGVCDEAADTFVASCGLAIGEGR